jgi:peptide/nickel transport system substrate-binding protein
MTTFSPGRRLLCAAAVVGLAASLGACGGSKSSSSSNSNYLLNVYNGQSGQYTANFNPFSASPTVGTDGIILEPLMFFNQAKADDVQNLLATKYEFADNGQTLNFTLRSGVKWSDGQAFSADDVVFTFNLIKNNAKLNTGGLPITDAVATDPTHVTLKFSAPVYTRLWNIAGSTYIVPKHQWQSASDPSTFTNTAPVGTGPFKLDKFAPSSFTLVKNPLYWDTGKPKIAGLRFTAYSGNDAGTAALAGGELDWAGMFIPDIDKQYVQRDPTHHKYVNDSFLYETNLVPNLAKAPTSDLAVRQAINYALDRDQLIKLAFSGYGAQPSPAELIVPLFNDYLKPAYQSLKLTQDTAKAGQTLAAAGYAKGSDGIYAKGGKKLSFSCIVVSGYSDYISALQIITQQLKAVGIDFSTKQESYAAFIADEQTGNFDFAITNGYGGPAPYYMYDNLLATSQTAPLGQKAQQNYSRFSSPAVDQALAAIAATPPDQKDKLKPLYYQIEDVVVAQLPYIPIQQSSALAEYNTTHATGWPTDANPYAQALPFGAPDAGIVTKTLVPTGK